MATTNISSIGTAARDYATINLWKAATSYDLVVADVVEIGECYADSTFDEHVVFLGATTDATRYREIRAAAGNTHGGILPNAGVLVQPSTAGNVFDLLEDFGRVGSGMSIALSAGSANSDECIRLGDATHLARGTVVEKFILSRGPISVTNTDGIYTGAWSVGDASNPVIIRDGIVDNFQRAGLHFQNFNSDAGVRSQYIQAANIVVTRCNYNIGYDVRGVNCLLSLKLVNVALADSGGAPKTDFGASTANPQDGTLDTTGSSHNFDEEGQVPGPSATFSPMILVNVTQGAPAEYIVVGKYGNMRPQNIPANDVLGLGIGPGADALVSDTDMVNNPRAGLTCDPSPFQISPTARNRAMVCN